MKLVITFLERVQQLDGIFNGGVRALSNGAVLTLSTLHSSKGLEFDTVYMIDLTNQEIPGTKIQALK